ncbi:acyltransferase [Parabacteroides sp.]|uniref:acyltransferase n=1 Tax=Parabacteroides sp. TaxID=1869337 RepID=UPI001DCE5859|nr:acyltransferase [Parabacteroides sp.]MBS5487791.1 acyltransferase [Parabacteroides sp.]
MFSYRKAKHRIFHLLNVLRIYFINTKGGNLSFSTKLDKKTKVYISRGANIKTGINVYLRSEPRGYHCGMPFGTVLLADKKGANIEIGSNSRINGAYIHAQVRVSIGKNCVIAAGTNIIDSNGHEIYSVDRTTGRDIPYPILIGNNVWIGMNSVILKGTVIGDNSVISAGSVVKGIFPSNSLIQGNPAKIKKILTI